MRQAAVLALDLATTTGWALHRPGMERPHFDSFKLPGGANAVGEPLHALECWLREMAIEERATGGISHFFFEDQHVSQNPRTAYRLIGLGALVEKFAFQTKAQAYCVGIGEWRKHFLGRGGGFKRERVWSEKKQKMVPGPYLPGEDPKEIAINRCAQYGWYTDVHDAAEACGILDYGLSLFDNYHRPWRDKALLGGSR